jgi:hypothetical protein
MKVAFIAWRRQTAAEPGLKTPISFSPTIAEPPRPAIVGALRASGSLLGCGRNEGQA